VSGETGRTGAWCFTRFQGGENLEISGALKRTQRHQTAVYRAVFSCGFDKGTGGRLIRSTLAVWGSGFEPPQLHSEEGSVTWLLQQVIGPFRVSD
jgi:hypothetical protein